MKILASDFDDTLFVKDKDILEKNITAIKKFIANGNIFCIITGRNYSFLKQELNKHNISYSYLICCDGAKIFNNVDYCIDSYLLSEEKINKCIDVLEKNNCQYYLDDGYNETFNKNDCIKVVGIFNDKEQGKNIIAQLKNIGVYAYLSSEHVNIIDDSVNKLNSLKRLFNLEELDLRKLYVIGNEVNDLEMLKYFNGAVMKEHSRELDDLDKKEYEYLYQYIEELSKN